MLATDWYGFVGAASNATTVVVVLVGAFVGYMRVYRGRVLAPHIAFDVDAQFTRLGQLLYVAITIDVENTGLLEVKPGGGSFRVDEISEIGVLRPGKTASLDFGLLTEDIQPSSAGTNTIIYKVSQETAACLVTVTFGGRAGGRFGRAASFSRTVAALPNSATETSPAES